MEYFQETEPREFGEDKRVFTVREWAITLLIIMIPVVNIIMLFVWAFGNSGNLNRKNWAMAQLLLFAMIIVASVLFVGLFYFAE